MQTSKTGLVRPGAVGDRGDGAVRSALGQDGRDLSVLAQLPRQVGGERSDQRAEAIFALAPLQDAAGLVAERRVAGPTCGGCQRTRAATLQPAIDLAGRERRQRGAGRENVLYSDAVAVGCVAVGCP